MPNSYDFNERLETAAKAKADQLAKARAKSPMNSPGFAARQEERIKASVAREQKLLEKAANKQAEEQRRIDEKKAAAMVIQQAAEAATAAAEAELHQKAADALALKAKQKAGRDAKYAARQARRDMRASSAKRSA